MRGDVPNLRRSTPHSHMFSPRARGCSAVTTELESIRAVFPACAGMFLDGLFDHPRCRCFPRVRGDVPFGAAKSPAACWFSPRARGCSPHCLSDPLSRRVFPACAGMFPRHWPGQRVSRCFPRVRGDVPTGDDEPGFDVTFSPRARGCSTAVAYPIVESDVFPACAGMFRPGVH